MKIKRWDVSVLDSRPITQTHNADFFTTDTDAWIEVYLADEGIKPDTATIIAYNRVNDSVVEEDYPVVGNLVKFPLYNEKRDLAEHYGGWVIRTIFHYEGLKYTARDIDIYVNGSEYGVVLERLEIVEEWNKIQEDFNEMVANEERRKELFADFLLRFEAGEYDGKDGDRGLQGIPGDKGDPFAYEDFTLEQLESLVGPKGDDGYTPVKGVDYFDGEQGPVGPAPLWEVISADEYNMIIPDPNTVYLVTDTNMTETDLYKMAIDEMLGGAS